MGLPDISAQGTELIDCRDVARRVLREARELISEVPSPVVVNGFTATHDPSTLSYARGLRGSFHDAGARFETIPVPFFNAAQAGPLLEELLKRDARDRAVTGSFLFSPIGTYGPINNEHYGPISQHMHPDKDVEGVRTDMLELVACGERHLSAGELYFDPAGICRAPTPCTAQAVVEVLKETGFLERCADPDASRRPQAYIVNNSPRIGQPLRELLASYGCDARTADKATPIEERNEMMGKADLIVTAVPAAMDIVSGNAKPGATVIDCSFEGNTDPRKIMGTAAFYVPRANGHPYIGTITSALAARSAGYLARWQQHLRERR